MAADPGAGWGREPRTGTLVAWSCTTGWLDWIHGELWLLPDGLLRIRLSLGDTQAHGLETLPPDEVPTRTIGDDEIEAAIRAHKTNHWIPADAIKDGVVPSRADDDTAGSRPCRRQPAQAPLAQERAREHPGAPGAQVVGHRLETARGAPRARRSRATRSTRCGCRRTRSTTLARARGVMALKDSPVVERLVLR